MFQQTPSTITLFSNLPDGLYLVKRPSQYPFIEHYGVLIVGQPLWEFGFYGGEPMMIHRTDIGVRADWAADTGQWDNLGQVPPYLVPSAVARFSAALQENDYNLFTNNCEHFARFVTQGKKQSTQVNAAVILGVVGFAFWAGRG